MTTLLELLRPKTLDDIIGQKQAVKDFTNWNKNNTLPHLLIYGTYGVGKSATIRAALLEYYRGNFKYNTHFINASRQSERGIGFIDKIINKMGVGARGDRYNYRVFVFEEADRLTGEAEDSLKEAMVEYSDMAKVIMVTNKEAKIGGAIQSRCTPMFFANPAKEIIEEWIEMIYDNYYEGYPDSQFEKGEMLEKIFNKPGKPVTPRVALKDLEYYLSGGSQLLSLDTENMSRLMMKKFINSIDTPVTPNTLIKSTVEIYHGLTTTTPGMERDIISYMFDEAMVNFNRMPMAVGSIAKYMATVDIGLQESTNPNIHMVGMLKAFAKTYGKKLK